MFVSWDLFPQQSLVCRLSKVIDHLSSGRKTHSKVFASIQHQSALSWRLTTDKNDSTNCQYYETIANIFARVVGRIHEILLFNLSNTMFISLHHTIISMIALPSLCLLQQNHVSAQLGTALDTFGSFKAMICNLPDSYCENLITHNEITLDNPIFNIAEK